MRWTRAINLVPWADTTAARHQLPLLLRKLLGATVPQAAVINFPADEQVQRPGFDGIVEVGTGSQFVTDGKSWWEMGAGNDPREKANEDFTKRTEALPAELRQETTFMFVTPRTWQGKDNWAREQRKKCQWKDVRVLDANDLEHWLERAPSVDVWLATEIGLRPAGVLDPNRYWQSLSSIADVPLSSLVFLASRESICKKLQEFLNNPPASVFLKSSGPRDGLDFLVAMLQHGETPAAVLERMIIVDEIEAWQHLTLSRASLLLVGSSRLRLSAPDVAEAVSRGHHVIVLGSVVVTPGTIMIRLKRQDHLALGSTLIDCGFDESRAKSVALGCGGSTTILKRLIAQHPDTEFPEWSRSEHQRGAGPPCKEPKTKDRFETFQRHSQRNLLLPGCLSDFESLPFAAHSTVKVTKRLTAQSLRNC